MALHTNIGNEFLPVEVADPNQLTSYVESYVLIPNLGTLLYSRLYRGLDRIVANIADVLDLIHDVHYYRKLYNEIPSTPYVPKTLINEGVSVSEFNIEEAYIRSNDVQPNVVLNTLNNIGHDAINASTVAANVTSVENLQDYKNILSKLSKKNLVINTLVDNKLMLSEEGIVTKKFLQYNEKKQIETIASAVSASIGSVEVSSDMLELGKSMTDKILENYKDLIQYKDKISPIISIGLNHFLNIYQIANPSDHIKVTESCEWAFLRTEKITLDLKRPRFRGPLHSDSISPKSELTRTESESRMTTTSSHTLLQSRDDLTQYNSISSEIKDKMGTMFDFGSNLGQTMSEQGYSQNNLKSEKRARVESALREISKQNSSITLSSQTLSSSQIKEYHTEGKDPKFATSEFSFEVFSPVDVKHYLEDISAVWCPRIKNPYSGLRLNLSQYYWQAYASYITENYVLDPMEPIPSYESIGRVSTNTEQESDPGTYWKKVTFKLTNNEINAGYFFGEEIQVKLHQDCDWYENCYDEEDYWIKIERTDRHGGNSWVDVLIKYKVDDVWGNDPDVTYIEVSIDKFKETEAYRQEKQQYQQTVTKINPARRNAVRAQAKKYASLKRDELVRKYESNINNLKDYAFTSLMKKMFKTNMSDGQWSYYQGIIKSCINWNKSRIDPEPCDANELYETYLSPYHYLNVQAIRFFLPIHTGAEAVFFDTMRKVVDTAWRSLFDTVENYINDQRDEFNELPEAGRLIDSYDSEIILGRHLEAVLSKQTFAE